MKKLPTTQLIQLSDDLFRSDKIKNY